MRLLAPLWVAFLGALIMVFASHAAVAPEYHYSHTHVHATEAHVCMGPTHVAKGGHVAAWLGVSNQYGTKWLQVGLASFDDNHPILYVETELGVQPIGHIKLGSCFDLTLSRKGSRWTISVDGKRLASRTLVGTYASVATEETLGHSTGEMSLSSPKRTSI